MGLSSESLVADIGSGTGILSELFLKNGNTVFCVEPNEEMRKAAEELLSSYPGFRSITGTAEMTTLTATSVDFITAAQAFHWFDASKTRIEFSRILKPGGWVSLIWNTRRNTTPLMRGYEQLVSNHATRPHSRVTRDRIGSEGLRNFLGEYVAKSFENSQTLNFEGLRGRLLSSSYVPLNGESGYDTMLSELRKLFDQYQENDVIHLEYDTELYCSQLST